MSFGTAILAAVSGSPAYGLGVSNGFYAVRELAKVCTVVRKRTKMTVRFMYLVKALFVCVLVDNISHNGLLSAQ